MNDNDKILIEQKVDAAVELKREIAALEERLDLLKTDLRVAAKTGGFPLNDGGNVLIRSRVSDNCATICFVDDKASFIKKAIRSELEARLPAPVFNGLFAKEIVFGDDFKTAIETTPKQFRKVIDQYVEWKPQDARVNLSK